MIKIPNAKYLLKKSLPVILTRGRGVYVYDSEGNKYLDMTATAWTMNLGYGNKKVLAATIKQLKTLSHCRTHYYTDVKLALAKKISKLSPIPSGRVDFCLHGSAANEGALKLALNRHVDRQHVLYLEDGFHGRTFATMAVSWKHHNYKLRPFYGPAIEVKKELSDVEAKMKKFHPAAFIIELVQGNGGQTILEKSFVKGVRALCTKYEVTLIVDEIQTGFGRCGCFFLSKQYGIVPDIITFGKAVSNGVPLFGLIVGPEYSYETDDHSFTYAHCPLGMASALATIEQLTPSLLKEALKKGKYMEQKIRELNKEFPVFGEIKQLGLMFGVDIVNKAGEPDIALAELLVERLFEKKIIVNLSKCKGLGYTLKLKPALIITYKELDKVFAALRTVLTGLKFK